MNEEEVEGLCIDIVRETALSDRNTWLETTVEKQSREYLFHAKNDRKSKRLVRADELFESFQVTSRFKC